MQDTPNSKVLLSIGEASEYLGISIDTLRRWEKKGKLVSLRSPGGHRYFNKPDLDTVFGRKYERELETKPRNITLSSKPDLQKNEEKNIGEFSDKPFNVDEPITSNLTYGKQPSGSTELDNYNPPYSTEEPTVNLFFSAETPDFQPPQKEIKIPQIPLIQVRTNERINNENNTSINNKIEQISETLVNPKIDSQDKIHDFVKTVDKTFPTNSESTLSPKQDKVLVPPGVTTGTSKISENNGTKLLYIVGLVIILLVIGILTYLYIQIPDTPLSPIP
jgi:excisionase family DNA binding protein